MELSLIPSNFYIEQYFWETKLTWISNLWHLVMILIRWKYGENLNVEKYLNISENSIWKLGQFLKDEIW